MNSVKHCMRILILCFICINQEVLLWAQSNQLPKWTNDANASIFFKSSVSPNAENMPASLYGFSGTAFGISVIDEIVIIERFELDAPLSGSYKIPAKIPPQNQPILVLYQLSLTQGSTGIFEVDCSLKPGSDSTEAGSSGVKILLSDWCFIIEKARLGPDGLNLVESYAMNDYMESSVDPSKAFVLSKLENFIFDSKWKPVEGFNSLIDPLFTGCLSGQQSDKARMFQLDGKLVIEFDLKQVQSGRDDPNFFKSARLDGQGNLTAFDSSESILQIGEPGNFQIDFTISLSSGDAKGTGVIHLPPSLGGGSYSSATDGIDLPQGVTTTTRMIEEFGVFVRAFAEPVMIQAQGWEIVLPKAQAYISDVNSSISSLNAIIHYQGVSIELQKLTIKDDGSFITTKVISDNLHIPMYGGRAEVMEATFGDTGIIMQGAFHLGDNFGAAVAYFDNLGFDANGLFFYYYSGTMGPLDIYINNAVIRLQSFSFSEESLTASDGLISFKWGDSDQNIPIAHAWINSIGTISIMLKNTVLWLNDLAFLNTANQNLQISDQSVIIPGILGIDRITKQNERISAQLLFDKLSQKPRLAIDWSGSQVIRDSRNGWIGKGGGINWHGDKAVLAFEKVLLNPDYEDFHLTNITVSNGGVWDYSKAALSNLFKLEHNKVEYIFDKLQPIASEPTWLEFEGRAIQTGADGNISNNKFIAKITSGSITAKIGDGPAVQWLLIPHQR